MKKKVEEQSNIKKCPHCNSMSVVKYGRYKNTQKFRCYNCSKVFQDKDYSTLTKTDIKLLSALVNLMDANIESTKRRYKPYKASDISKIMKSTDKEAAELNKIKFYIKSYPRNELFSGKNRQIECYKPLVILCQDDDKIKIIKLEEYDLPYSPYSVEAENIRREITLVIKHDKEYLKDLEKSQKLNNTHISS